MLIPENNKMLSARFFCRMLIAAGLFLSGFKHSFPAQNYEVKSVIYNTLTGAVSGGIGSVINKKPDQKWYKAFRKGFLTGAGGGAIMYCGKKTNYLVAIKKQLGYAWVSRAVFSLGNSIVENASANIDVWTRWHFDIGFVRLEFKTGSEKFTPRLMPSALGGIIYIVLAGGQFNINETIRSGTLTFNSPLINYANQFVASTPSNAILHTELPSRLYYQMYAHEMIHTFQFQENSGFNYFLQPVSEKLKLKSERYRKLSKWIYLDLNYELMGINYFIFQKGYKNGYCNNFLENEAEFLITGHGVCK